MSTTYSKRNYQRNDYGQGKRSSNRSKRRMEPRFYNSVNEALEDLNIKRPRNGYLIFSLEKRNEVEDEGFNGPDAVAELGRRWNSLDPKEKRKYEKKGEEDSKRYQREKMNANIITPRRSQRRNRNSSQRRTGRSSAGYSQSHSEKKAINEVKKQNIGHITQAEKETQDYDDDADENNPETEDGEVDKTYYRRQVGSKNRMSNRGSGYSYSRKTDRNIGDNDDYDDDYDDDEYDDDNEDE